MKPHSRGLTTSPYHHHHHHHNQYTQSKYQFTSTSWRELKYFQIFNLHHDETFQTLMTSYYNVILSSIMEDSSKSTSISSESDSNNKSTKNLIDEESQISDKLNSFIDSKYDLRIFANSLVSYEEVKEAYLNLSDPIKRKYYWIKGSPLSENAIISNSNGSSTASLSISIHSDKIVNNNNNNNNNSNLNNIQSPLSLFSLLNGSSNSGNNNVNSSTNNSSNVNTSNNSKSSVLPYLNNTNNNNSKPEQCTQPTVDQVIIPKNGNKSTIQLLLNWKCNSNVQEYCLMMKSPTKPEFHVIYRGHNGFFTTPPLETGTYNFKARATNRFGVGEYSKELEYNIKDQATINNNIINNNSNSNSSSNSNSIHNSLDQPSSNSNSSNSNSSISNTNVINNIIKKPNIIQNKPIEEQKIKQRDEILNEINQFLNQNCKSIVQNSISMNQCDELLNQLLSYQTRFSKFSGLPNNIGSVNQDEVVGKLESTIETIKQLFASYKLNREWKILLKNSLSEFIHNSSSNDNEQLERIRNLISNLSDDMSEQMKTMILQTIIQFTKKKLNENSTIRSRTAILLTIFARNNEFFGENGIGEMELLAKQLFESKKKKKSNITNSGNQNNTSINTSNKKQKPQPPTSPLPKTTKLQINTTPQLTMAQLHQQQQQLQQSQQNQPQSPTQQKLVLKQSELVPNSQNQQNNILNGKNNNLNNSYHIDNYINNVKYTKSQNIPIHGSSIKSSADEIIHDFKVPSSPTIGSNLIVSPPKSSFTNNINYNSDNSNFYKPASIPFQGFLTPVLSNLHQNVNLSTNNNNSNNSKDIPNSPTLLNNDTHQQKHNQNVFNSYNYSQPNQSLFFNQPFNNSTNNNNNENQFENLYSSQDDFFRQLMDNNFITTSTTTTTTTTTIGRQSPPLVTNPFQIQHPQQQTLIPLPSKDNTHSFSFYHIVPNNQINESLNF